MLLQSRIPIESLAHPVAYNIHFGKGFLLTHWKNLLMRRSSRENLCKKRYCDVPKTNRFVLKILEKLNHFVLKVRTGGFADSKTDSRNKEEEKEIKYNKQYHGNTI